MDIKIPIVEYGSVAFAPLREKMLVQPESFWEEDRASRVKLAGNRPGNAVFLYNDVPKCVNRPSMREASSGYVNVLRYPDRPLFKEVDDVIELGIRPHFPNCDPVRVQLAELPPGMVIKPHVDKGLLTKMHRLHVPLVTHEGVKFIIAGKEFFLKVGVLYDLNNVVRHSVENKSEVMRVHMLVDMLPHSVARVRYHDTEQSMMSAVRSA
jgi:Aspartyl/Asparaginyl beta-hydroxylase